MNIEVYREDQKARQWWWFLIIIPISVLCLWIGFTMIRQYFADEFLSGMVLLIGGIIIFAVGVGFLWLLYAEKLTIEVRTDGLYIRYYPFQLSFRKIPLDKLKSHKVRNDIMGLGIGYPFRGRGKVYNISGNRGLQLDFVDGKRLLIGSQKPEELANAIDIVLKK